VRRVLVVAALALSVAAEIAAARDSRPDQAGPTSLRAVRDGGPSEPWRRRKTRLYRDFAQAQATGQPGAVKPPQRVVSTAPSITEMLFALGAGDRVVGVTTFCRYPDEAKRKPKIGGFASPNIEAILQQKPDLVVVLGGRTDLSDKLRPFEVSTLVVRPEKLEDIESSLSTLAARLGLDERGRQVVADIRRDLDAVHNSVGKLPRRTVLFVVGRDPGTLRDVTAVGRGSYLGQLVELSGGTNVFHDAVGAYSKVSLEEILARDPDVIIDMSHGEGIRPEDLRAIQALWSRFPSLRAVRNREVHIVTDDIFVVPGPRVGAAVRSLARMIHGDVVSR
jgi:iron complex transport system substrate-binding protein